ncbi:MAG: Sec-independent protein translocase subunit TatA/TatB [Pirellulaceae bacterium]
MLPSIGITELVVLGVVAIVLFGKRLPEVARNVGRGYGELRKGLNELQSTINTEVDTGSPARRDRERISGPATDDLDEPTAPSLPPPPEENS